MMMMMMMMMKCQQERPRLELDHQLNRYRSPASMFTQQLPPTNHSVAIQLAPAQPGAALNGGKLFDVQVRHEKASSRFSVSPAVTRAGQQNSSTSARQVYRNSPVIGALICTMSSLRRDINVTCCRFKRTE